MGRRPLQKIRDFDASLFERRGPAHDGSGELARHADVHVHLRRAELVGEHAEAAGPDADVDRAIRHPAADVEPAGCRQLVAGAIGKTEVADGHVPLGEVESGFHVLIPDAGGQQIECAVCERGSADDDRIADRSGDPEIQRRVACDVIEFRREGLDEAEIDRAARHTQVHRPSGAGCRGHRHRAGRMDFGTGRLIEHRVNRRDAIGVLAARPH